MSNLLGFLEPQGHVTAAPAKTEAGFCRRHQLAHHVVIRPAQTAQCSKYAGSFMVIDSLLGEQRLYLSRQPLLLDRSARGHPGSTHAGSQASLKRTVARWSRQAPSPVRRRRSSPPEQIIGTEEGDQANLDAGLFHGEYGSQGVAIVSATAARAAVKMRQARPLGSPANDTQRLPTASAQPPARCFACAQSMPSNAAKVLERPAPCPPPITAAADAGCGRLLCWIPEASYAGH